MMNKKGYLQISFAWLFAIIVGILILVLSIYGVTKLVKTGEDMSSAKTGREIGILLNPLETGFETGKTSLITMPVDTRIYNKCYTAGTFGIQTIQVSKKNLKQWSETERDVDFENKYIFSGDVIEGKNFHVFLKPFEFPFKVADLAYITSSKDTYCFVDSPVDIEKEISNLNQANLFVEDCPEKSVQVCFSNRGGCEVNVNTNQFSVEKAGDVVYYETDALMYAAIFSDKEVYECQVQRLMKKTQVLARLYNDKNAIISKAGCSPEVNLVSLIGISQSIGSSEDLVLARSIVKDVKNQNERAKCMLW